MAARITEILSKNSPFFEKDLDPHPPRNFADRNVFSKDDIALVESLEMNHPAENVMVEWHDEEREVQPFNLH